MCLHKLREEVSKEFFSFFFVFLFSKSESPFHSTLYHKIKPFSHNLYLPLSTNISIRDGHHGDNELANEGCNYSLPDRKTCGDQGSSELPIRKTHLINGPEGDVGPSCPCPTMGWKGSNVFVDPYIGYAASVGWESAVVDDGLKRHDDDDGGNRRTEEAVQIGIECVLWSVITHLCRDSIWLYLPCLALLYFTQVLIPPMYLFLSLPLPLTHTLSLYYFISAVRYHLPMISPSPR